MCNHKLRENNERATELIVHLDAHFVIVINMFVVSNVFEVSAEEFQSLDQQSQIELTCKRRAVLGEYLNKIMGQNSIKSAIPNNNSDQEKVIVKRGIDAVEKGDKKQKKLAKAAE